MQKSSTNSATGMRSSRWRNLLTRARLLGCRGHLRQEIVTVRKRLSRGRRVGGGLDRCEGQPIEVRPAEGDRLDLRERVRKRSRIPRPPRVDAEEMAAPVAHLEHPAD